MYPLLSEVFPLCLMGLGVSRRGAALLWRRGCSNCSQSLYSEGSRYMWVWHVYVLECRGCLRLCVYIAQQIHACSDVYCVCSDALILLNILMLTLTTSVHISTSTHIHVHMHMHTEPSLTLDTLSSVLDGVQHLDDVGFWLQIPSSKRNELERQYDRRQLPRAYSTVFLTDNPSPSWSTVAYTLWQVGELGALEVVQKLYLKGEPCAHSCRSEGRIGSLLATLFYSSDTVCF